MLSNKVDYYISKANASSKKQDYLGSKLSNLCCHINSLIN